MIALSEAEIAARLSGSPEERAAFLRECAEGGVAEAQALYGQLLLDGTGVVQDAPAALGWFVKAAAQHHLMAINMVGRCYDLGWGTAPDKARERTAEIAFEANAREVRTSKVDPICNGN